MITVFFTKVTTDKEEIKHRITYPKSCTTLTEMVDV